MSRRLFRYVAVPLLAIALSFGLVAPSPAQAGPKTLSGSISGIEFCPQFVCGAAYFAGSFSGSVGGAADTGYWLIGIRHDALPETGGTAAITGGDFTLFTTGSGLIFGRVKGGTLTNNGDGTFDVNVELRVPGSRPVQFSGILDHTVFPPTIAGTMR